jgi:DNA polymerase III psi subunit
MNVLFKMNDGGSNLDLNKVVCIYVEGESHSTEELKMLEAMMAAIHIKMEKVELVHYTSPVDRLPNNFRTVFIFGLIPGSLDNLEIKLNHTLYLEGKVVLATYSLSALHGDKNKKLALWKILQSTFLN